MICEIIFGDKNSILIWKDVFVSGKNSVGGLITWVFG
jgi:hypothetical protein